MSTNPLKKIDVYYPVLFVVLIVLSVFTIFTFRGLFSAFVAAYETEEEKTQVRIDKNKLNQAYDAALKREIAPLVISE